MESCFNQIQNLLKSQPFPLRSGQVTQLLKLVGQEDFNLCCLKLIEPLYPLLFENHHKQFAAKVDCAQPPFWDILVDFCSANDHLRPKLHSYVSLLSYSQLTRLFYSDPDLTRKFYIGSLAFKKDECTKEFESDFVNSMYTQDPLRFSDYHSLFLRRQFFNPTLLELIIIPQKDIYIIKNLALHAQATLKCKQLALDLLQDQNRTLLANRQSNMQVLKIITKIKASLGGSPEERLTDLLS